MINLHATLEAAGDKAIADAIVGSFEDIVKHYALRMWRAGGIDAGHFVEAVRRFLEFKLTGRYTSFSKSLPNFNEVALKSYENATGDESYRIIIPRILYGAFAIRNKRGIGHKTSISPNEMDAVLLLHTAKWVLAELIRLNSKHSAADTERAVAEVVRTQIPLVWEDGATTRVLDPKMSARDQSILLLALRGDLSSETLRAAVGYKNKSSFNKILGRLHDARLIERSPHDCKLTPLGFSEAEQLVARGRSS